MVQYQISCEVRKWSVYVHINKINGKKYVGLSNKKPSYRWGKNGKNYKNSAHFYAAIQKYGWNNFDHIILESGLTKNEASALEILLIKIWNTTDDKYGYNFQNGGYMGNHGKKLSEEQRKKRIGKQSRCKKVVCLNTGIVYPSLNQAAITYSMRSSEIANACNGTYQYTGRDSSNNPLKWMYYNDYIKMTQEEIGYILNKPVLLTNSKQVICLNNLKIFNSIKDAAKYIGTNNHSGIIRVCQTHVGKNTDHNRKYCGKDPETGEWLSWMYLSDYDKLTLKEKDQIIKDYHISDYQKGD